MLVIKLMRLIWPDKADFDNYAIVPHTKVVEV
jgi:hypothetical protein